MKTVHTSITIKAPVEKIWDVFLDIKRYEEWNTFLRISGALEEGNIIEAKISPKPGKTFTFKPRILTLKPHTLVWEGVLLSGVLFKGRHIFRFEKISDHETAFYHEEIFSGLLTIFFNTKETEEAFCRMNKELKRRAEAS